MHSETAAAAERTARIGFAGLAFIDRNIGMTPPAAIARIAVEQGTHAVSQANFFREKRRNVAIFGGTEVKRFR
jgi:hypothetical protein